MGIPNLGCSGEGNLIQCKQLKCDPAGLQKQQGSEVALGPGPFLARQLCFTLLCSAPLWRDSFIVSA